MVYMREWAFLSAGFRVFFFLGSMAALLILPYWLLLLSGQFSYLPSYFSPYLWHVHEMIFAMVAAIIIGFVYTAVPNWTGRKTPTGLLLALLALLWIAGRVAVFFSTFLHPYLVMGLDGLFLPLAALGIIPALVGAGNKRNYFLPVILLIFTLFNMAFHLSALEMLNVEPRQIFEAALLMVVLLMNVIGGRIIPAFSKGKYPALKLKDRPRLLPLSVGLIVLLIILRFIGAADQWAGLVALGAGLVTLIRLTGWQAWKVWRDPLLFILPMGYAWIVAGFFLYAAALLMGDISLSPALHAFSVGAVGSLTLGVMSRASLGHSGLALKNDILLTLMFMAITLAAFSRTILLLVLENFPAFEYGAIVNMSAIFWVLAYGLFLFRFTPIFFRPRL